MLMVGLNTLEILKMFKLFHKSKRQSTELLTSTLHDERSFYRAFVQDLKHAQQSIIIESPFMTKSRVLQLIPTLKKLQSKGIKARVNTRHPRYHDGYLYYQAWMAADVLRSYGVKVRFYRDMRHRKIAIIDDHILWEGSLNILSHKNSREIMRRTNSEKLCKQMANFTGVNKLFR